jgi:hypothetical protein
VAFHKKAAQPLEILSEQDPRAASPDVGPAFDRGPEAS